MRRMVGVIYLYVVSAVLLSGCARTVREVGLTRDNVAMLSPGEVKEVNIISHGMAGVLPYSYDFYITDPAKIDIIVRSVQDVRRRDTKKQTNRIICLRTRTANYCTGVGWDEESVYGLWWESVELREHFADALRGVGVQEFRGLVASAGLAEAGGFLDDGGQAGGELLLQCVEGGADDRAPHLWVSPDLVA